MSSEVQMLPRPLGYRWKTHGTIALFDMVTYMIAANADSGGARPNQHTPEAAQRFAWRSLHKNLLERNGIDGCRHTASFASTETAVIEKVQQIH